MTMLLLILFAAILGAAMPALGETVSLRVRTDRPAGRVDERIYSHFFEHIYHSANGGLWGEVVWNRSFESFAGGAQRWSVFGGELGQTALGQNPRIFFGEPDWTDVEFRVEAMKTGGAEGFLLMVRANEQGAFYWANLGGWGNVAHQFEHEIGPGRRGPVGPRSPGRIETGRWYALRVRCEGPRLRAWIDDELVLDFTDGPGATLRGRVGLGTWYTTARFRNLRVTDLDGRTLWSGLPQPDSPVLPPEHWTSIGEGAVAPTDDVTRRLNGAVALLMDATRGPAGVRQTGLRAVRGDVLSGSIWVCGAAPRGLAVRLTDKAGTIAEAVVGASSDEWREYPLRLRPAATPATPLSRSGCPKGSPPSTRSASCPPPPGAPAASAPTC